jgi:predicted amidophosphoribosyltransferase
MVMNNQEKGIFWFVPEWTQQPIRLPDTYFCMNCKEAVNLNDPRCRHCEEDLDWAGIS